MNSIKRIKTEVYDKCDFKISHLKTATESTEYEACSFTLDERNIISRKAKITPKKIGQFVTFWKRNDQGITTPFHQIDPFDFYLVTVISETKLGQFVFPKSILVQKGILSTNITEGKRGFRVYPIWDTPTSKQAIKTQQWQLAYFYEIENKIDLKRVHTLYRLE